MTDLIDRQALLAVLTKTRDECVKRSKTYGDKDPLDEDQWESMAEIYSDVIKQVEEAPIIVTMTIEQKQDEDIKIGGTIESDDDEPETMWRNHYVCPECNHQWTDDWPAQCDDDCPRCGFRNISPTESEEAK